jgi:hypothetical protein
VIVKASFILFAIVLPLAVLGVLSVGAFWAWGGQGACFLPPLFGVYFFALLVVFEVQKRRGMRDREGGNGQSSMGNGEELD